MLKMIEFEADEARINAVRVKVRTLWMGGLQTRARVIRGFWLKTASAAAMEQP